MTIARIDLQCAGYEPVTGAIRANPLVAVGTPVVVGSPQKCGFDGSRISGASGCFDRTPGCGPPVHRSIVAVDIEGSTARTNPHKARLRQLLYSMLEAALTACGMTGPCLDPLVDRGDGVLIFVKPSDSLPKTLLVTTLTTVLHRLLSCHNAERPTQAFRLRVAVHAGEVHYDTRGPFGESVELTCRLLDSPELKSTLKNSGGPMVLVVSDVIYRSVIMHGYSGIDTQSFTESVRLEIAGYSNTGWTQNLENLPSR